MLSLTVIDAQKKHIEPWLSAVFQSEHLGLLLGSGFTTAVAYQAGTNATGMECDYSNFPYGDELKTAATKTTKSMGRGEANIEDQIRAANLLAQGLEITENEKASKVKTAISNLFKGFLNGISETVSRGILSELFVVKNAIVQRFLSDSLRV